MPYYQYTDNRKVLGHIVHGILPILHPQLEQRSTVEHTMVQVVRQLMQHNYADRPTVDTVMEQLRWVRQRNSRRLRHRRDRR